MAYTFWRKLANMGGALVKFWVINVEQSPQVDEWECHSKPRKLPRQLASLRGDKTQNDLTSFPQHPGNLSGSNRRAEPRATLSKKEKALHDSGSR